jgi:hypothetical protein
MGSWTKNPETNLGGISAYPAVPNSFDRDEMEINIRH